MGMFPSKIEQLGASIEATLKRDAVNMTQDELNALDAGLFDYANHDSSDAERAGYSNYSYWHSTFRIFWRNKMARFLVIFLVLLLAFAPVSASTSAISRSIVSQACWRRRYSSPAAG